MKAVLYMYMYKYTQCGVDLYFFVKLWHPSTPLVESIMKENID